MDFRWVGPEIRKKIARSLRNRIENQKAEGLEDLVMHERSRVLLRDIEFGLHAFPISHLQGWHLQDTGETPRDDLERMLKWAMGNLREGIDRKLTMAKETIAAIAAQIPKEGPCAYKKALRKFLVEEYAKHARPSAGLWSTAQSDDTYLHLVEFESSIAFDRARDLFDFGCQRLREASDAMQKEVHGSPGSGTLRNRVEALCVAKDEVKFEFIRSSYAPLASYRMETEGRTGIGKGVVRINEHLATADIAEVVVTHEVNPGHHFEVTQNWKRWYGSEYWILTHIPGYIEGWATFIEAKRARDEKRKNRGQVRMEVLRAARVVIDAGMHAQGCGRWSFKECRGFLSTGRVRGKEIAKGFEGIAISKEHAFSEILAIASRPGYATSYSLGKFYFDREYKRASEKGMSDVEIEERMLRRRVPLRYLKDIVAAVKEKEERKKRQEKTREKQEEKQEIKQVIDEAVSPITSQMFWQSTMYCCC